MHYQQNSVYTSSCQVVKPGDCKWVEAIHCTLHACESHTTMQYFWCVTTIICNTGDAFDITYSVQYKNIIVNEVLLCSSYWYPVAVEK